MKSLYEVRTDNYKKRYFVLAESYDDAKRKAEDKIVKEDKSPVLTFDGSINTGSTLPVVREILDLTSEFIR